MRILLCGQRSFGAAVYDAIVEHRDDEIVGVWSPGWTHDDPDTRGRDGAGSWSPKDPLTARALKDSVLIHPMSQKPDYVRAAGIDLIVAAHSHHFISGAVREATRLGGVGYHPSLLPRHRGRDAIRWTIHMGDPITGGTVYWLTDNVDGGPVAAQQHVFVHPNDDASSLWERELFPLGVEMLLSVIDDISDNLIVEVPQNPAHATWEPSWERPPLLRPDLPQLGSGLPGFQHITTRVRSPTWKTRSQVLRDMGR